MADNSEFPEDLFVVHTEYPRFILNVEEEEVEWLDDLEGDDEETIANRSYSSSRTSIQMVRRRVS